MLARVGIAAAPLIYLCESLEYQNHCWDQLLARLRLSRPPIPDRMDSQWAVELASSLAGDDDEPTDEEWESSIHSLDVVI